MLDAAVSVLVTRLDAHLRQRFGSPDSMVVQSMLTDGEGKPVAETRNRLALFVTNISQDTIPRKGAIPHVSAAGIGAIQQPPVHLNIYFMIAAGFDADNYSDALKVLTASVEFFQAFPLLTPSNTPEMPAGLSQLSIEISNLEMDTLSQLWGAFGGRYVPSVHYKMRSVAIDSTTIVSQTPLVSQPERALASGRGS
ncbi:MAG: DUF4255 domain-containing protein [Pseudomonadota bacterium]